MSAPSGTSSSNAPEARPNFKKGLELRLRDLQDWLTAQHERELLNLREQNRQLQTELQHKREEGAGENAPRITFTPATQIVVARAVDAGLALEHESNLGHHGRRASCGSKNEARDHLQLDLEDVQRMKRRPKTVSESHSWAHERDPPRRRDDGTKSLPLPHVTKRAIRVASDGWTAGSDSIERPKEESQLGAQLAGAPRPSNASSRSHLAISSEAEQNLLSESEGEGNRGANHALPPSCHFVPVAHGEEQACQKLLMRGTSSDGLDRAAMRASKQMSKAALAVPRNKVVPADASPLSPPESTTMGHSNEASTKSASADNSRQPGVTDHAAKGIVAPDGNGSRPPLVDATGARETTLGGAMPLQEACSPSRPNGRVVMCSDELRNAEVAVGTTAPKRQRRNSAPSALSALSLKRLSGPEKSARQRATSVADAIHAYVRTVACKTHSSASGASTASSKLEPLVRPARSDPAEIEPLFVLREGWMGFAGNAPGPAWEILHSRSRQDTHWRSPSDASDWSHHGLMMRPAARKRTVWDVAIFVVIVHDIIMVPLRVFGLPSEMAMLIADWVGNIFWMFDIAASFTTGTYIRGELEMRPRPVAIHYLQTWFLFDVVLLIIQWVLLADVGPLQSRALVSCARVLRFLRMLRALRLDPLFHDVLCRFHFSERLTIVMGISRQATCLAVAIHLIACAWYGIGYDGWVQEEFHKSTSIGYRYLASLRWALSQLLGSTDINPSNTGEAAFAVLVQILGYLFFCVIMSCALRALAALEDLGSETRRKQRALARYLKRHRISPALSVRVNKFIAQHEKKKHEHELGSAPTDVLLGLSQKLQDEISEEIRRPVVMEYQFLVDVDDENTRMVVQLCHEAIFEEGFRTSDIVFSCGDACRRMLFVASGTFEYVLLRRPNPGQRNVKPDRERSGLSIPAAQQSGMAGFDGTSSTDWGTSSLDVAAKGVEDLQDTLERGRYLCEAILWTRWEYCGELSTEIAGTIFALDAQQFAEVVSQHASASYYAGRYATKFVRCLNRTEKCSDLVRFRIDKVTLEEEAQQEQEAKPRLARSLSMVSLKAGGPLGKFRRSKGAAINHYIFISHHKAGAGTEAALMQEAFARLISEDPDHVGFMMDAPVFLDSEDLVDLTDLKVHVRNSINLVLLLTTEVLERPWVLVEIVTATQSGINIIPVEVQKREANFDYPDEAYFQKVREGSLDGAASVLLKSEGISMSELERALRNLFKKIALPFSPHKSANVREAELIDILRRCQDGDALAPPSPSLMMPGMIM